MTPKDIASERLQHHATTFRYGISPVASLAAFQARQEGMSQEEIDEAIRKGESKRTDGLVFQEPDGQILDTRYWDDYWIAFLIEADERLT